MVVTKAWREEANFSPQQNQALDLCINHPNAIVLYGGAGYGGKSHLLRYAGPFFNGRLRAQGIKHPKGVLFCSTYKALEDRHLGRLDEDMSHIGKVVTDKTYGLCFRFHDKSMGVIALRNLDKPDKYRSAEFDYALFEELTEFTFDTFSRACYSIRSSKGNKFLPILCASNPDGVGHMFVKTLFVPEHQDFSLYPGYDKSRIFFVQALPQDNPTWEANPQVQATLNSLPEVLRRARLEGSWDAPEGARFPQLNKYKHQFKFRERFPQGLPSGWPIILGIDWGKRNPYACLWIAIDPDKNAYVFREDYQPGFTAIEQAERMVQLTGQNERIHRAYADPACWSVYPSHKGYTDDSPKKDYDSVFQLDPRFENALPEPGYNESRMVALNTLDNYFSHEGEDDEANAHPKCFISEDCPNLWRELTGAIWDTRGLMSFKREDIDDRNPDHAITALYYALHTYIEGPTVLPANVSPEESHAIRMREQHERDIEKAKRRLRLGRLGS